MPGGAAWRMTMVQRTERAVIRLDNERVNLFIIANGSHSKCKHTNQFAKVPSFTKQITFFTFIASVSGMNSTDWCSDHVRQLTQAKQHQTNQAAYQRAIDANVLQVFADVRLNQLRQLLRIPALDGVRNMLGNEL